MWLGCGRSEESENKKDLEEAFQRTSANIHRIPTSIRFDDGNIESACAALNALLEDIMAAKPREAQANVEIE
jgi:DNA-binding Xre family transcriptional regulator